MLDPNILEAIETNTKERLSDLSNAQPILLVFLRHFGCVFCKEALTDLAQQQESIKEKRVKLVFVHMASFEVADQYFKEYGIQEAIHISDPEQQVYRDFGITKGSFSQLYGLRTWARGFSANKEGHKLELSKQLGDSTQMPGIFLIYQSEIKERYIHKYPSDRPNYLELVKCCTVS